MSGGSLQGENRVAGYRQDSKVEGGRLVYSNRCGRVMLNNVIVQNRGVDWDHESNIFWQHKVCLRHTRSMYVMCHFAVLYTNLMSQLVFNACLLAAEQSCTAQLCGQKQDAIHGRFVDYCKPDI